MTTNPTQGMEGIMHTYQFTDPSKPDCPQLASWENHFARKGIGYTIKPVERRQLGGFDGRVALFIDFTPMTADSMGRKSYRKGPRT